MTLYWNKLQDIYGDFDNDYGPVDNGGSNISLSPDGFRLAIFVPAITSGSITHTGLVNIYQWGGTSWDKLGTISGDFGTGTNDTVVSLSYIGTRVAIGNKYGIVAGRVSVYEYDGTSWKLLGGTFVNDDSVIGLRIGQWVSLSYDGSRVAIGSPYSNGGGTVSGSVSIYEYNETSWELFGSTIDGDKDNEISGYSVSLSSDGSRVAIGSPYFSDNLIARGRVSIYEYNEGSYLWVPLGDKIDGDYDGNVSGFSVSLSPDGLRVAIGSPYSNGGGTGSGSVTVYEYDGSSLWVPLGDTIYGDGESDNMGTSVSLSYDGSRVAIGAPFNGGSGDTGSGHVIVYEYNGTSTSWEPLGDDIYGEESNENSGFRVSLSSNGSRVAIGAPRSSGGGTDRGRVSVYALQIEPDPLPYPKIYLDSDLSRNKIYIGDYDIGEYDITQTKFSILSDKLVIAYLDQATHINVFGLIKDTIVSYDDHEYSDVHLNYNGDTLIGVRNNGTAELDYLTISSGIITRIVEPLHTDLDNSLDMISMSEDGTMVLLCVNNTVYFYRIYDNTIVRSVVYKSGSDVKSISLSRDGRHIAIGLSHTDITSYLINNGKVITYIVSPDGDTFLESGHITGKWGNERLGSSVSFNTDGTELVVGIPGYRRFYYHGTSAHPIALHNNGAVRKYIYDNGWNEDYTINNPVENDSSGTFGTNVILSPNGENMMVLDTDNGIYSIQNTTTTSIGTVDTPYQIEFFGNVPYSITNDGITSIYNTTIVQWEAKYINSGIGIGDYINTENIDEDYFYITSLSSDGRKLAVSQRKKLDEYDKLVIIYILNAANEWVYDSNISASDVLYSDLTPTDFDISEFSDNKCFHHKLSGDGNTFIYGFNKVDSNDITLSAYTFVFKYKNKRWVVTAVLEKPQEGLDTYLQDQSITNNGQIYAASCDDRTDTSSSSIFIFLLNADGQRINSNNEEYDAGLFNGPNITITNVDNGFSIALNGDATLDSPWVTLAVSSVVLGSTYDITIYKIPNSKITSAYGTPVTYNTTSGSRRHIITSNPGPEVHLYDDINTYTMRMNQIFNLNYDSLYRHTIDISDDGNTIALSNIRNGNHNLNYTTVIRSETVSYPGYYTIIYTFDNIYYSTHNNLYLNWGWHLRISGDGTTIVMGTNGGAFKQATSANPYAIVYKYLNNVWKRIDYDYNSMFDSTSDVVAVDTPDLGGQNAYPSISKDGNTVAVGIYFNNNAFKVGDYYHDPNRAFVLVYNIKGDTNIDTNTISYDMITTSTSVITSLETIISISSNSSFVAIATRNNVHLYDSVHYGYVYDLLSDCKRYRDIFNVTLNPSGGYIAIEYHTYISIFSIRFNKMVLMTTIDNNYVNSRDLVWTTNGKLVIGTQNGIILYNLTTRNINRYDNARSTIYRIVDDSDVFNYNGTLNLYHYVNGTSNNYTISTSLHTLQHFPGQTDKFVGGIPDERKIIIYSLTSSVQPDEGTITNALYSGFGKEIVIKSFSDSITRIFVSCDNYIHIYDYEDGDYKYYRPFTKDDVFQVKYDATGIFVSDNDERKSLSFKSI